MGQLIKKTKLATFIIILLEILIFTGFVILYLNNIFGLQDIIDPLYILLGSGVLVLLNIIFLWITIVRVSSLKQKTVLKAAEVIGSDVQEAYNFAMVGLVVTDDSDTILWTNDLFTSRHIDIIDNNILSWQPLLADLKDPANKNENAKIEINSRHYEVKYLSDASLWIFKDTTELESNIKYNREQAPVIGILSIDNYEEILVGEEDTNDTVARIKNVIFTYAKTYGILIKRIKDGVYSLLCNYKSFCKMKEDKFSILDKAREETRGEVTPVTLSLGIAYDFPDVVKLNEMANNALDIAMSRGGDQVVISAYGGDMEFFGGKSEAQEKRYKVQVRVFADSLIQLIRNSRNVLVMGHVDMDMDALGACLGVRAICMRLEKDCRIVADLKSTESKTRAAITSSFSRDDLDTMIVSTKDSVSYVDSETLLIVVDVHTPKMVMDPALLNHVDKVVVIDHHRRAEDYIDSPVFNHIDPAASSASEIITEFIRFTTINPVIDIPPIYATIMLSGIFLDSGFFRNKSTGIRTFEASTILKEYGADNSLADDFLKDDYEEVVAVNKVVENLKTPAYGVVYAIADKEAIVDRTTLAKAANQCLSMKNIHAAFIIGKTGNKEIRMSCRSDGSINVQLLAEKLGGGGHFSSSAALFEKASIDEVEQMLNDVLRQFLAEAKVDVRDRKYMGEEN